MSDEQWRWCETCGDRVSAECIAGCRHFECPMKNRAVDTGDDLHKILGAALRKALAPRPDGKHKETCERCQGNGEIVTDWETLPPSPRRSAEVWTSENIFTALAAKERCLRIPPLGVRNGRSRLKS